MQRPARAAGGDLGVGAARLVERLRVHARRVAAQAAIDGLDAREHGARDFFRRALARLDLPADLQQFEMMQFLVRHD
ncbi:hypothetical protein D3C71_938790 [compost metagenome]